MMEILDMLPFMARTPSILLTSGISLNSVFFSYSVNPRFKLSCCALGESNTGGQEGLKPHKRECVMIMDS